MHSPCLGPDTVEDALRPGWRLLKPGLGEVLLLDLLEGVGGAEGAAVDAAVRRHRGNKVHRRHHDRFGAGAIGQLNGREMVEHLVVHTSTLKHHYGMWIK